LFFHKLQTSNLRPRTTRAPSAVPQRVYLFLALGLAVASQSGNIVRLGDAPPLAIAAWRLALATALFLPFAGADLRLLRKLSWSQLTAMIIAGVALAAHFVAWIAAVQNTTVANASIFFAINPIFTATASFVFFRERFSLRLLASIGLGLAGVGVIGWGELSLARAHLYGDGLALLCAVLFTLYFLMGKSVRRVLPTTTYVVGLYGVAALASFAMMLALEIPFVEYDGRTWLCFLLMALGPTMIGHTSFNHALAHLKASWISTATLSEPLLASLVAYLVWKEDFTAHALTGYLLIAASVLMLVSEPSAERSGDGAR
jgi:drug/metabolite transporter (DMT)-like permease